MVKWLILAEKNISPERRRTNVNRNDPGAGYCYYYHCYYYFPNTNNTLHIVSVSVAEEGGIVLTFTYHRWVHCALPTS